MYVPTKGPPSRGLWWRKTGGTSSDLHGGGLSGAARLGDGELTAQTVLAEIGNIPVEMACECVTEICNSGANIIVVGDHTDITTYRALLRAGATEYFGFPVTADEIIESKTDTPSVSNIIQIPIPPTLATSIAVMDRDETAGFFEALMTPDRIDSTFVKATMDQINDRFRCIPIRWALNRMRRHMRADWRVSIQNARRI